MENKLENIGQNNFMDNFVKTEDILKKYIYVELLGPFQFA